MNNHKRDDSVLNRLTTFLNNNADLSIQSIKLIKPPIYLVTNHLNQQFILKGYKKLETIDKQWQLFDRVDQDFIIRFCPFPNKKRYLKWGGYYWTLQKYYPARKLDYHKKKDRKRAWRVMKQFHHATTGLTIPNESCSTAFVPKCKSRLNKWQQSKEIMDHLGYQKLYQEIELQLIESIEWFVSTNNPAIEDSRYFQANWIHGDVASHNFLSDNKDNIYLIDFDLLSPSPSIYDEIQLGQRFLPYIEHDFDQLNSYIEPVTYQAYQLFFIALTIPTDFVREWWYYISKSTAIADISSYLIDFQLSWEERRQFVETVKRELNR
ncbi:Phosphotransferase enzyme family protein [Paraliobacillus sp. PM-2]|uniref:phosphotransferase n=1 Tax=Paraliobacillus sp. PM-2 TaxID=1462524 RepID=UPI00061CCACD|nr:phosphotransferase [Paraliobacillus sp. PM-2]CQR46965.1 Phosphotransferase enzyme family protein [Paraliobacillus sp. PM-2]